eukprot:2681139-Prymnesium_polylepis.1
MVHVWCAGVFKWRKNVGGGASRGSVTIFSHNWPKKRALSWCMGATDDLGCGFTPLRASKPNPALISAGGPIGVE